MKPIIAIDGTACSGKGTIAQKLASHYNFAYLDTGMLYRTVAYMNIDSDKISELSINDIQKIKDKIPKGTLHSDEVSSKASKIAGLPHIREAMTKLQRDFAADPGNEYLGSVLDGRDIGSVVVPNANCKIFITADCEIRAKRRFDFLKQTNPGIIYEEVLQNLIIRDKQDQSRKIAPLTFNKSYLLIDTSNATIDESFARVIKVVEGCLLIA